MAAGFTGHTSGRPGGVSGAHAARAIKGALFEALRAAGPDGLDINQMVDAVQV